MDDAGVFLVLLLILALNIALLVWVYRDAKKRGLKAGAWLFVVWFFSLLGLAIYLVQRPRGPLVECSSCGRQRPASAWVCPHCGARTHASE